MIRLLRLGVFGWWVEIVWAPCWLGFHWWWFGLDKRRESAGLVWDFGRFNLELTAPCDPANACKTNGQCFTHSHWDT